MGKPRIRAGQIWLADLGGHQIRVHVVGRSATPDAWVCEEQAEGHPGTGPCFLLHDGNFLKPEGGGDEASDS